MVAAVGAGVATTLPSIPGRTDRLVGALIGTAVGDALGLPREGHGFRRLLPPW